MRNLHTSPFVYFVWGKFFERSRFFATFDLDRIKPWIRANWKCEWCLSVCRIQQYQLVRLLSQSVFPSSSTSEHALCSHPSSTRQTISDFHWSTHCVNSETIYFQPDEWEWKKNMRHLICIGSRSFWKTIQNQYLPSCGIFAQRQHLFLGKSTCAQRHSLSSQHLCVVALV